MAASVAAASSANRRRRHDQAVLKLSITRAKEAEERREYRCRAKHRFLDMSRDGYSLDKALFKIFLEKTLGEVHLNKHALQMAKNTAERRTIQMNDTKEGTYPIEALLDSVESYREYIAKEESIVKPIFQWYNKASDGKLKQSELKRALQDHERKAHRAAHGLAITLLISPQDMDYIMKKADANSDGKISRAELLPAMEIWERLAEEKIMIKQQSSCGGCMIL